MRILTAEQMRSIDRRAIDRFGIPSIVLMENAAAAVVDVLLEHYPDAGRVALVCGTGQNGGDGFAAARHLESRGVTPVVLIVGGRERVGGDALTNLLVCERLNIPIFEIREPDDVENELARVADVDVIADAMFGTGLNRAPSGIHADVIRGLAELRIPVIAVDVPSGTNASSPLPFEPCVQAEVTVTFAAPKICHVFEPAAHYCGQVVVADISIPDAALEEENVQLALITPDDIRPHVAARAASSHKGTFGHLGIIAGSPGRSGAAVLAARGALRMGAGLVTVMTDEDSARLVHAGAIESMTDWRGDLRAFLDRKSAIAIGPGLPDDDDAWQTTRDLVAGIEVPLVVDASALNAFAGRIGDINSRNLPAVLTPHPGEMARLLGTDTDAVAGDRIAAVRRAASLSRCVVVLKGHQSLVAEPDGHVFVNPTGNPGMASGGMGDVLTGMIGALLARGADPLDAACTAVYLHGLAGDRLAEETSDIGLTATDLAERLPSAVREVREP
jgi:NAD(P)H-hydrate epimerase